MSAGTYNIEIEKGATFSLDIDYKDSNSALYDLSSNYSAKMYIKANYGGDLYDSNDGSESINNIVITLASTSPNLKIKIPHTSTDTYTFESAEYVLELTNTVGNEVTRLLQGDVTLDFGV